MQDKAGEGTKGRSRGGEVKNKAGEGKRRTRQESGSAGSSSRREM